MPHRTRLVTARSVTPMGTEECMRQERLASLGVTRPRLLVVPALLVAPALLITAGFGFASLRQVDASNLASATADVAPPGPARPQVAAQPRSLAQPRPIADERDLARVPAVTSVPPTRVPRRVASDEVPKDAATIEIRLIADSPTLPQVVEPPPPPPEPRSSPVLPVDSVWRALAQCESGGNWQSDDGNGYYGGLQFDLLSWQEVGGEGYPSEHPPDLQIEMAERLLARQGWSAWPTCSRALGLE